MSAKPRGSRGDKEREKVAQDRLQLLLTRMLKDEDNKYCVDCDSKGPRWASWNLGLFMCIRCAGIHRNLGVHISKVKSVNLDSWTPVQVSSMQLMGNSRARAVYEANLPDGFVRPQNDQALEQFIRAKYEKKKYMAKEYVPQKPPEFPEGWNELIEAEKQKKDLKKIILPSHTHSNSSKGADHSHEADTTARPKVATTTTVGSDKPAVTAAAAAAKAAPAPVAAASSSAAMDLLGLGLGGHDHSDGNGLVGLGSGSQDILGLGSNSSSGFGALVSAGAVSSSSTTNHDPTSTVTNNSITSNDAHDGFFNAAPSSSGSPAKQANNEDSSKMSKDSIMALFGKSNSSASLSNMYGATSAPMNNGSGMFGAASNPSLNSGAMFGGAPSSSLNNGAMGIFGSAAPHAQINNGGMFGNVQNNSAMFGGLSSQQPNSNGSMGMFGAAKSSQPQQPQQNNMFMQNMNGSATTGSNTSPFGGPAQSAAAAAAGFGMNQQSNPFLSSPPASALQGGNGFAGQQNFMGVKPQQGFGQTNQMQMQNQFGGLNLGTNTFSGMVPANSPISAAGSSNSWTMGQPASMAPTAASTAANQSAGSQANNLLGLW